MPDQISFSLPSSRTIVISKEPRLGFSPGLVVDSKLSLIQGQEESTPMLSAALLLNVCQEVQWTTITCKIKTEFKRL